MSLLPTKIILPQQQPSREARDVMTRQVQQSISETISAKTGTKKSVRQAISTIKYHADEGSDFLVHIAEKRVDPLDPSRFRNRKPVPLQKEDPAPILTTPEVKLTEEEERYWSVPSCVSNWKNPEGYVIPMDKRVGADARRFERPQMSDGFTAFTRALDAASISINESLAQRNLVQRQLAQKKQREEEERLREEARRLNEEKRLINKSKNSEERKIDKILQETKEQRQRIRRQKREFANRDITAQTALGLPILLQTVDDEFDPQLFDKSGELDQGFNNEEAYNIYDKPIPGMGESLAYVPFAGDRAFNSSESKYSVLVDGDKQNKSSRGSGYTIQFKSGEKQVPDSRAGLFIPNKDNDDSESD